MPRKTPRPSFSSQKSSQISKSEKKLRFNEENIQETHHPAKKDYGFMTIPEAKTPFPRHADPVGAEELRKRLQESLDRANRMMRNNYSDDERSFNRNELSTQVSSLDSDYEERRRDEFYKKRKQFNQSEYIIAQQKPMNTEMPEPGPSVGDNWRIVDNEGNNSLYNIPSNVDHFVSRTRSHRYQSTLNYETLREITDQMSQSSEQLI